MVRLRARTNVRGARSQFLISRTMSSSTDLKASEDAQKTVAEPQSTESTSAIAAEKARAETDDEEEEYNEDEDEDFVRSSLLIPGRGPRRRRR